MLKFDDAANHKNICKMMTIDHMVLMDQGR